MSIHFNSDKLYSGENLVEMVGGLIEGPYFEPAPEHGDYAFRVVGHNGILLVSSMPGNGWYTIICEEKVIAH